MFDARDWILEPVRTNTDPAQQKTSATVDRISRETTVPMLYVPGGGAIILGGCTATAAQKHRCQDEMAKAGFVSAATPKVKSADAAAAGGGTRGA